MASIPSIVVRRARNCREKFCKAVMGVKRHQQHQKRSLSNITAAEREEFEENGAVCLRGVFDETWLKITEKGNYIFLFSFGKASRSKVKH